MKTTSHTQEQHRAKTKRQQACMRANRWTSVRPDSAVPLLQRETKREDNDNTLQGLTAIRLPPSSNPKVVVVQSLNNRVHETRSGPQGPMRRCKKDMPPPPMTLVTVCAGLCFTMRGHYHPTVQRELQREGERGPRIRQQQPLQGFSVHAHKHAHTQTLP